MIKIINIILITNIAIFNSVASSFLDLDRTQAFDLFEGCINVDIRYDVKNFDQLEHCKRVYNGLKIAEFPNTTEDDFKDVSYPELVEIKGYLQIDGVSGLKSLENLFPNLKMIQGQILIHGAVIMITNNPDLEKLGLRSLGHIGEGKMVIEHNPNLCDISIDNWQEVSWNFNISQTVSSVSK